MHMCAFIRVLAPILAVALSSTAMQSSTVVDSADLAQTVLNSYLDVYPICTEGSVVQVYINVGLTQLIEVDAPKQTINLNIQMDLEWIDCNLNWNATQYNIEAIEMLSSKSLWLPDISWNQRVGAGISDGLNSARARVYANGTVFMTVQLIVHSFCSQNIRYFPFDAQSCDMTFSSWLHDQSELNLTNMYAQGDLRYFGGSDEWDVTAFDVHRQDTTYCCTYIADFAEVKYTLKMIRKPLFYLFNLVYPVMLISVIGVVVFLLPPQSGEKVTLSITVLLSLTVYMLLIAQNMPEQSVYIPLLGLYFAAMILMVTASCGLSVYVVNLHFRAETGEQMSGWVRRLMIDKIGRLLNYRAHPADKQNATNQLEIVNGEETFMDDWMRLACIVDRICLLIFGMTVLVVTSSLAAVAYYNYYHPPSIVSAKY